MPLGLRKIGILGAAAGLLFLTGCMETTGPVPETARVQDPVQKHSAYASGSDSSFAGVSIGRTGTATVNATFKSTNP